MYTKVDIFIYISGCLDFKAHIEYESDEIDTYCHKRRVYPDRRWPLLLFACVQSLDPDQHIKKYITITF